MTGADAEKLRRDFEDFTEEHYRRILRTAKEGYEFAFLGDRVPKKPHIVLRHDVDFSVHRALKIAEIEGEYGVASTFFVRIHSEFYNLFERGIFEKIKKIAKLGHRIGLHFEGEFFTKIEGRKELEEKLLFEKDQIERPFKVKINAFSFHNPEAHNLLRFDQEKIGSMFNAYSDQLKRNYKYCSDSNGYWRHERIFDVVNERKYERLYILTHPEWWQEYPMSPKEKVNRAINSRAQSQLRAYRSLLESAGREDVG